MLSVIVFAALILLGNSFDVIVPPNRRVATTSMVDPSTFNIKWYFRSAAVMDKYISKTCAVCGPLKLDMSESSLKIEKDGGIKMGDVEIVPASNKECQVCLMKLLTG